MTVQAIRRINWLLGRYENPKYLEIGVSHGKTFLEIEAAQKVAVDPKFQFDMPAPQEGVSFHQMTSDEYFERHAGNDIFDVIFLDGLHVFEQTMRDFCNSLTHIHQNSIIVIDDTVPCDPYSALRDQREAVQRRLQQGGNNRDWHGDIYKVVMMIHDFFPDFSYATVMGDGNPQTVVWRGTRNLRPSFSSIEGISRASYFDFLQKFELINPKSTEDLKVLFGEREDPEKQHAG